MKKCIKSNKQNNDHKPYSGVGRFYTSSAGTIVGLICGLLCFSGAIALLCSTDTHATPSTLNLSLSSDTVSVDIASLSSDGTFAESSISTITASTNNATGYKLKLTASNGTSNNCENSNVHTQLVNGNDNSKCIDSIASNTKVTKSTFSSSSSYNNMWGYIPSQYYDSENHTFVDNTARGDNAYFFPAPSTSGDIIAETDSANTESAGVLVPDTYTIGFGVRIDSSTKIGTYSNTYVVQLVADAVPYSITYIDGIISNMPADTTGTTDGETVSISGTSPSRADYTFLGWCSTIPTNYGGVDSCSGTTYNAGGSLTIDRTSGSNAFTLYAMWKGNYSIGALEYLQDFSTLSNDNKSKVLASMTEDTQYKLKDRRDEKEYWIAKLKDGNVWMTQQLDLKLQNGTKLVHATSDIGWTENNPNKEWDPARTMIDFEGSSGTTVTGYKNDNNTPYSASPYYGSNGNDVYILSSGSDAADTVTNLAGCIGTDKSETECAHYKVGNYYNFAAATATNNIAETIGGSGYTVTDADAGTIMPDSVCPAGWRLPKGNTGIVKNGFARASNSEFDTLLWTYGISANTGSTNDQNIGYADGVNSLNAIRSAPLYFVRSGIVYTGTLGARGADNLSWSGTIATSAWGYNLKSNASELNPSYCSSRHNGLAVRCVLR